MAIAKMVKQPAMKVRRAGHCMASCRLYCPPPVLPAASHPTPTHRQPSRSSHVPACLSLPACPPPSQLQVEFVDLRKCCIGASSGPSAAAVTALLDMLHSSPTLKRVDLRGNDFDKQGEKACCWGASCGAADAAAG